MMYKSTLNLRTGHIQWDMEDLSVQDNAKLQQFKFTKIFCNE